MPSLPAPASFCEVGTVCKLRKDQGCVGWRGEEGGKIMPSVIRQLVKTTVPENLVITDNETLIMKRDFKFLIWIIHNNTDKICTSDINSHLFFFYNCSWANSLTSYIFNVENRTYDWCDTRINTSSTWWILINALLNFSSSFLCISE